MCTGILSNPRLKIQAKFMNLDATGNLIIGEAYGATRLFNAGGSTCFLDWNGNRQTVANSLLPNNIYEFEIGNYYVKNLVSGTNIITGTLVTEQTRYTPVYIDGDKYFNPSPNKWYYLKVYCGDSLERDFIPVRVGQVGYLYDKVTKRLFGSATNYNYSVGQDLT